jgi:5'-3' exonuclease
MTQLLDRGRISRAMLGLMLMAGILALSPMTSAQEKAKADAKDQKKPDAKDQKKPDAKPTPSTPPPQSNPDDPAKLKAQITALQKEVAALKLKIATMELEKLGALVTIDKAKDGTETATVNILKKWSGDKDALQLLKNVPNLQVVYIDNSQVNDAAVAPLKDLSALSALTEPYQRD